LLATWSTLLLHATLAPSLTTPLLIGKTCVCYALILSSIVIDPSPHVYRYLILWSHKTLRPSMLHSCHNFEQLNLHSRTLIMIMPFTIYSINHNSCCALNQHKLGPTN
jgi:hypothetical protein